MKKTKIIAIWLAACLLVTLLAACGSNSSTTTAASSSSSASDDSSAASSTASDNTSEEVLELKLAHNTAASSMTGEQYHAFAEIVAEESGGSIVITEYPAGSLITDSDALDGVMDGTVDFAHGMVSYLDGIIKDLIPLDIPGYYTGDDFLEFADAIQPVMESIFADYNVKFLGSNYQGQAAFASIDECVKVPSDLNGKSVRAAGTYISKAVEAWGGAPTTIALADLTTALERKTVDVAYTGWNLVGSFKLYEMAPYVTITTITESYACLMMSMDTWNSMTAEQQDIIETAAERWRTETYNVGDGFREANIEQMKADGAEVYEMTPEETQAFIDLSSALYDEIEPSLGDKGLELLNILKDLNS